MVVPISSFSDIDPRTPFPFERGVDLAFPGSTSLGSFFTTNENFTVNATAEKQIGSHTNLRLDYTRIGREVINSGFRLVHHSVHIRWFSRLSAFTYRRTER